MTTKTWSRNMGKLAIDPDETGLVAGYNMVPRSDGTIEDLSGNGNHGTIEGPAFEYTEIGPSMKFDGVDDEIEIADDPSLDITDDLTLSCWVNPTAGAVCTLFDKWLVSGNQRSFKLDLSAVGLLTFYISGTGADFDSFKATGFELVEGWVNHPVVVYTKATNTVDFYFDGVLKISQVATLVLTGIFNSTADLFIGGDAAGYCEANISYPKMFTRALTAAEIQAEYLAGAKAINWKSDYGVSESTAAESAPGELSNSPARVISGTHKISSDTINGKTAKIIECVTAGVVAIPTAYFHGDDTQAAYGTFEWWMKKGVIGTNTIKVNFISSYAGASSNSNVSGYQFLFDSLETVKLRKITAGAESSLAFTPTDYVQIDTWYKAKITRSKDGDFTFYLDDLIVVVTGGTNPVTNTSFTTSKYIVLELDAGDKVGWSAKNGSCAIVKYEGIV